MPYSITNFFGDVNSNWLSKQTIPSNDYSISYFDKIEKSIQDDIYKLIRKERSTGSPYGEFLESFYTGRDNDVNMMHVLAESLTKFTDHAGLMKSIGMLNLYDLRSPIALNFGLDMKNVDSYTIHINEAGTGLLKSEYAPDSDNMKQYKEYLVRYGEALGFKELATKFLHIEKDLVKLYEDNKKPWDLECSYNPMTYNNLCSQYAHIDFVSLFESCCIPEAIYKNKLHIVSNMAYMNEMNKYMKTKTLDFWRVWIKACVFTSLHGVMGGKLRRIFFDFELKHLQGLNADRSLDEQALAISKGVASDSIGKLYILSDKRKFAAIKKGAREIVVQVKATAHERIDKMDWLSESSRLLAKHKLSKMKLNVAYPDIWYDVFDGCPVDRSQFLVNYLELARRDTLHEIKKMEDIRLTRQGYWDATCFEVNAYYYGEQNEFFIPVGFLFAPFYSRDMSFVQNLAGLGNIVGHEISHGFDKDGRKFDARGNNYAWWSSLDLAKYRVKTRQVIDLFNKQKFHGLKVNGTMTLDENLADIGGLAICLDVLKKRLAGLGEKDRKAQLREFFIWYSKGWAYKATAQHRRLAIKSDVHSPAELRVNTLVPHFDDFYYAFGFKEGDEGYVKPENRLDVWGR